MSLLDVTFGFFGSEMSEVPYCVGEPAILIHLAKTFSQCDKHLRAASLYDIDYNDIFK